MSNPLHQFLFFSSAPADPGILSPDVSSSSSDPAARFRVDLARKRRSKLVPVGLPLSLDHSNCDVVPIPRQRKPGRKPDPNAPKITRLCSECGKKFWSCKALFGHMRCHPERQWRGMNPPVRLQPQQPEMSDSISGKVPRAGPALSEGDHEVASYLLMLANGRAAVEATNHNHNNRKFNSSVVDPAEATPGPGTVDPGSSHLLGQFECSSCKKVFGSHQALGGHRASHNNVKGCFANAMMSSISTECCENIAVSDHNRKKSEFREYDNSGGSLPTRLVIDSLTAVKEICGVDLSLRLGI